MNSAPLFESGFVWAFNTVWTARGRRVIHVSHRFYEQGRLVLSCYISLKQLHCPGNGSRKKRKKQSSVTIKTVCQNVDNCGHVEHRISIPLFLEFIRYCFLTILKHFNWCTVYSTKNARYLFVSIYLFIYLVCGFECIFMHTYYTLCFWALGEGCIVTQT